VPKPSRPKRRPRIFLGPTEVAGCFGNLTIALRDLGVDAVHVNLSPHRFGYPEATPPPLAVRLGVLAKRRAASETTFAPRIFWRGVQATTTFAILLWALVRFDVFVFGFGQSLLRLHELALLKLLRKRLVFVLHGSDARPAYMNGATSREPWDVGEIIARTRALKRRLGRIERYADTVIADPTYCQLLEKPIVLRALIGRVITSAPASISEAEPNGRRIRVLHAPSDPVGKGSDEIRRIFRGLQARGHDLELVELDRQPNAVVLDAIARCDFVADQLYTDIPMATLATEAAVFGKPALVGSYAREDYRAAMPPGTVPPTVFVHPTEFESAAERLLSDPELRRRLGREAREFASSRWAASEVAERFMRVVTGDIPDEWVYDPATLRYARGYGFTDSQVRALLAAVVDAGGVAALQVADKPELERHLIELASGAVDELAEPELEYQ
jgi:glycosyltransferase involved in cell wall biosynthesis